MIKNNNNLSVSETQVLIVCMITWLVLNEPLLYRHIMHLTIDNIEIFIFLIVKIKECPKHEKYTPFVELDQNVLIKYFSVWVKAMRLFLPCKC